MGNVNSSSGTGIGNIPNVQALNLFADLDAAHTFNALGIIPDHGEIPFPGHMCQNLLIRLAGNSKVIGNSLKGAVAASDTGRTMAVML